MIEIIIMLFLVLPWFYRIAKQQGRDPVSWVVIGALSYYIPDVIMGRVILPAFLEGQVTTDNFAGMLAVSAVLCVGAGISGCLVARRVLLSKSAASLQPSASEEPRDSSANL